MIRDRKRCRTNGVPTVMSHFTRILAIATSSLVLGLGCSKPTPDTTPPNPDDDGIMCTMDAKICPDGSAVGRSGPDCEFDPCPAHDGDELTEPDDAEPDDAEPDDAEPDES
jgi:hypothetical protein